MNPLWTYFWPCFVAGLIVGAPAATIAFRRRAVRIKALAIGVALSFALAALWHGPLGGADRFAAHIDRDVRQVLTYYEMTQVSGHVQHGPLARQIQLSGPADDFQRSELVRLLDQLPGVAGTSWSSARHGIPLILEGLGVAVLGFLLGLGLAYLVELHRRYNAQWNW
jgi:hypothetical protein